MKLYYDEQAHGSEAAYLHSTLFIQTNDTWIRRTAAISVFRDCFCSFAVLHRWNWLKIHQSINTHVFFGTWCWNFGFMPNSPHDNGNRLSSCCWYVSWLQKVGLSYRYSLVVRMGHVKVNCCRSLRRCKDIWPS